MLQLRKTLPIVGCLIATTTWAEDKPFKLSDYLSIADVVDGNDFAKVTYVRPAGEGSFSKTVAAVTLQTKKQPDSSESWRWYGGLGYNRDTSASQARTDVRTVAAGLDYTRMFRRQNSGKRDFWWVTGIDVSRVKDKVDDDDHTTLKWRNHIYNLLPSAYGWNRVAGLSTLVDWELGLYGDQQRKGDASSRTKAYGTYVTVTAHVVPDWSKRTALTGTYEALRDFSVQTGGDKRSEQYRAIGVSLFFADVDTEQGLPEGARLSLQRYSGAYALDGMPEKKGTEILLEYRLR